MLKLKLTVFGILFSLTLFSQSVPYNVHKRKYPLGEQFQKLLPVKLDKWNRYAYHDFVPNHENGYVYYKKDNLQVYLTFGKAYSQSGLNYAWTRIYDNAVEGKEKQVKQKNTTSTTNKYVLMNGESGYYFAWTRNFYYFTLKTKSKAIADEFMSVFPY